VPYKVVEFQETPNPHAVKCIVDPPVPAREGGLRSYQSAQDAAGDPLAARLMGVPGVAGVFINQGWVTVTRKAGEEWRGIKSGVRRVLAEAP
jgi:Scaffold protein Nfu/NifU N terminal